MARPHVRRRAAGRRRRDVGRCRAALQRAPARRVHRGVRVPLPPSRSGREAVRGSRARWRGRSPTAAEAVGIGFTLLPVLYERAGFTDAVAPGRPAAVRDRPGVRPRHSRRRPTGAACVRASRSTRSERPRPASIEALLAGCERWADPHSRCRADGRGRGVPRGDREQADRVVDEARRRSTRRGSSSTRRTRRRPRSRRSRPRVPGSCCARRRRRTSATGSPICRVGSEQGVPLSVGSDSQVGRDALAELRWLENGQRLTRRERNVGADPEHEPSTAARLVECVRAGGGRSGRLRVVGPRAWRARRPSRCLADDSTRSSACPRITCSMRSCSPRGRAAGKT